MVGIDGQAFLVLHDLPEHCIGDEIAVVGLAVAVAVGGLRAVQLNLALGKDSAVFLVDAVDDLLRGGSNGRVLGSVFLDLTEGVALDLLARVVDDDDADVSELRAGGLDGLAVLALRHHGVGVRVDDEVDTLDSGVQIGGAIGLGLGVHAQMGNADDDVVVLERLDLVGGSLGEGVIRCKGQALDEGRVRLGLGLGRLHAEEADLHAGLSRVGVVGIENRRAVSIEYVGTEDLELRLAHIVLELGKAVVKLVVAEGDDVVTGGIHHLNGIQTLGVADIDFALAVVARIDEDDLGALGLVVGLELCDVGIACDRAVHIVCVQDHGLARHRRFFGHDFGLSCSCRVLDRKAGHSQAEDHRHCEQDG